MNNINKMHKHAGTALIAVALLIVTVLAHAEVNLPNGDVSETVAELRVQALGGSITIDRQFLDGRWQINPRWNPLAITRDSLTDGIQNITRNGAIYLPTGDGFTSKGARNTVIRAASVSTLPVAPSAIPASGIPGQDGQTLSTVTGYRWTNNTGASIDYDQNGRVTAYADRNDIKVWLQYDAGGPLRYVLDHFGRVVFTLTWENGLLVQVSDNPALLAHDSRPARSVRFQYAGTASVNGVSVPLLTQVIDVLGYATKYTYAGAGGLATVTDAENRTKTYNYGASGRVSSVVEADGAKTDYSYDYDKTKREFYVRIDHPATPAGKRIEEKWYDAEGRMIRRDINGKTQSSLLQDFRSRTLTDAAGLVTTKQLDEYDNPVKVTYPDGSQTTARYSARHGQIEEEVDELGVKTTYTYDSKGNLTKKTEAVGLPEQRVTEYTVDVFGQRIGVTKKGGSVTLPNGSTVTVSDATTSFEYDSFGNAVTRIDAEGAVSRFKHDRMGNPIEMTDARDHTWRATYDASGKILTHANPLNQAITFSYNKVGEWIAQTDGEAHTTAFTYDAKGRLIEVTDPLGYTRKQEYDTLGQLAARIDESGNRIDETAYDLEGRIVRRRDGNGNVTTFQYGADGTALLPRLIQFPTFTATLIYDNRWRNIEVRERLSDALTYISKQAFDKKGNLVEIIDRKGIKTAMAYDALGRLVRTIDVAGGVSNHAYDFQDNLLAVQDPNGGTTIYTYDREGRRTSETRPLGQMQRYSYDVAGNPTEFQDVKGNKLQYAYDAANRRIRETHLVAGSQTAQRTVEYSYNAAGAMTGYTDANNATGAVSHSASYTLDALHRKTQEAITYGSYTFASQASYHPTGKKESFTYPDNFKVEFAYDSNQVLNKVTLPTGSMAVAETLWNQPALWHFPGGISRQQQYDAMMRLAGIKVNDAAQATLLDYHYDYDAESNIIKKQTEHGAYDYGYDALYRLTQANNPSPLANESYTYDKLGNRLSDSNKPGAWQYNANNQLLKSFTASGQAVDHTYDANGSLTKKTGGDLKDSQTYAYDASGRLIEVKDASGNLAVGYQYDPLGRRISKLTDAGTTFYLYSDEGLIAEATATGTVATEYGWKPNDAWSIDPLFIRTLKSGGNAAEVFYYQNDHLGSPQQVIDQGGNIVWEGKANAFGDVQVGSTSMIISNLRFPGQYFDKETNLHYNYFRDYDPATGRYIQSDPIGLEGGNNTYAYVEGNPIRYTDPTGEFVPQLVGFAIGAGLEALSNPCPLAGDILLAGGIGALGGGLSKAAFLRLGPRSLTRETGLEWSHSISRKNVNRYTSGGLNKGLNQRGGLNGSWRTPQSHAAHDPSRHVAGVDPLPLPIRVLDRIPDWLKGTSLASGAGAAIAGGDCECR
jgi:RHS repeat-associated protein